MINEELIEKRLGDIENKIDQLMKLTSNTKLSEYKLDELQEQVKGLAVRIEALERKPGDTALKWIATAAGCCLTLLIGYIAVKIGLK